MGMRERGRQRGEGGRGARKNIYARGRRILIFFPDLIRLVVLENNVGKENSFVFM